MLEKSLSVIIPAYNEEELIQNTLISIDSSLKNNFRKYEIIVVDDASEDDTCSKVIDLQEKADIQVKLIRNDENRGKGLSVKKGMLEASLDYVLFLDADLSTHIDEVLKFLPFFDDGFDIVIGSRALPDSNIIKKQGLIRRNMGKFFNLLVQVLLLHGIWDTQCGFKCFRREVARKLFSLQRMEGFCFDVEILFAGKKCDHLIKEVPISWINRESSRVSVINDSMAMFIDLFKIKINGLRGFYEAQ